MYIILKDNLIRNEIFMLTKVYGADIMIAEISYTLIIISCIRQYIVLIYSCCGLPSGGLFIPTYAHMRI